MTVHTYQPCVCVCSESESVPTTEHGKSLIARRRSVCEFTHTVYRTVCVVLLLWKGAKLHTHTTTNKQECVQSVGTNRSGSDG